MRTLMGVRESRSAREDYLTADETFSRFVMATGDESLRLAILLTGSYVEGQDLLQTVHEQLYRQWTRRGMPESPKAYLRTALVNGATRSRRLHARRRETLTDEIPDVATDHHDTGVLVRGRLLAALRRLSRQQRTVLVLRYFLDMTEGDTAQLLSCSVNTVKTQAARGLQRLRSDTTLQSLSLPAEA